jgi:hypothetical protein
MTKTLKSFTTDPEPIAFSHKIGSTLFQVNVHYDEASAESLEDKIFRMLKNDLTKGGKSSKMAVPQADWLPERGSV